MVLVGDAYSRCVGVERFWVCICMSVSHPQRQFVFFFGDFSLVAGNYELQVLDSVLYLEPINFSQHPVSVLVRGTGALLSEARGLVLRLTLQVTFSVESHDCALEMASFQLKSDDYYMLRVSPETEMQTTTISATRGWTAGASIGVQAPGNASAGLTANYTDQTTVTQQVPEWSTAFKFLHSNQKKAGCKWTMSLNPKNFVPAFPLTCTSSISKEFQVATYSFHVYFLPSCAVFCCFLQCIYLCSVCDTNNIFYLFALVQVDLDVTGISQRVTDIESGRRNLGTEVPVDLQAKVKYRSNKHVIHELYPKRPSKTLRLIHLGQHGWGAVKKEKFQHHLTFCATAAHAVNIRLQELAPPSKAARAAKARQQWHRVVKMMKELKNLD